MAVFEERGLQENRQIVEAVGNAWMFRAETFLPDGHRAAHQRFGFGPPVGGLECCARLLARAAVEADSA